jgi:glycosyltransferase involved in cell wall biosynthesis
MDEDRAKNVPLRLLIVSSHVIQYGSVRYREMARDPKLDLEVAFCSLQGVEPGLDPESGIAEIWDVPLLDGYAWTQVPNRVMPSGLGRFFKLVNTRLWKQIRKGRYDAVAIDTGYRCATFWIALAAAKLSGTPLLFATDVTVLNSDVRSPWKVWIKRRLWPALFRSVDGILAGSSGTLELARSLGVPNERITVTPNVVDNEWWRAQSLKVDRAAVRTSWEIPLDVPVALFCAKLVPRKRPMDVLQALAKPWLSELFLVFAGDGPLREELQRQAGLLGVAKRVRILGFVNQTALPAVYVASDVLVLPSDYDAFGLVVNEAMLCGCTVVISDGVGAKYDLVREGETGYIYPCGDVPALAGTLRRVFEDKKKLQSMREAARRRIETWSPKEYAESVLRAVETQSIRRRKV